MRFLGFFIITRKSLEVKFKPNENMIKIMPKGPKFFTNSTYPHKSYEVNKKKFN